MKSRADLLNDMATTWDFSGPTNLGISNDKRDFTRPREPFYTPKLPVDLNSADDSNSGVITLAPVEIIGYKNPISQFEQFFGMQPTGKITPQLVQRAKATENQISQTIGASAKGMIFNESTNNFVTSVEDVSQALNLIKQKNVKPEEKKASRIEQLNKFCQK